MDQRTASRGTGVEPAIAEILERARRLTDDDVVDLAHAYVEATDLTSTSDALDRRRILALAKARAADRAAEIRALENDAASALRRTRDWRAKRALTLMDALEDAELALIDAVLSIALRDRLGVDVAQALRAPWERVA
jgi:hypothetical protein